MIQIPQSTARVVMLKVFETGTTTAATGKTVAVTISKAGGAFGNPNAGATNATEVSAGWYKVTLDTTDTGTVGDLVVRGTATDCDATERIFGVVKATNGGLTGIPDAAAGADGGLPVLSVSATTLAYTVSTVTTYTGNTPQTGDSFARIGATGSGLTSLAPSATALSTAVWTAPPTGFLAATFPTTVASTTNITAGTITTVTTLTNLPAITSNWLTAAGIAADAGTEIAAAVLAAGDIDGYSLEEAQKLQLAALVGEVSGAATTTVVIRAADDSKARITATVDADGNRTALTLDEAG